MSTDRKALIRLAASLEAGSDERRAVLQLLKASPTLRVGYTDVRPFTSSDWRGYVGAEEINGGSPNEEDPVIGSSSKHVFTCEDLGVDPRKYQGPFPFVEVVGDGTGYGIFFQNEDGLGPYYVLDRVPANQADALANVEAAVRDLMRGRLPRGFVLQP